jgi:nucleotide-binding universal stress UspA family protein
MTERPDDVHTISARDGSAGEPACAIVVGYEHRPAALAAIACAAELATRLSAALHVVHAIELTDYPIDPDSDNWEQAARQMLQAEEEEVAAALSTFSGRWSFRTGRGDPVRLLRSVAEDTDALMIVVGQHSDGFSAELVRLFDGSTQRRLVSKRLSRPVLIVPHPAPA